MMTYKTLKDIKDALKKFYNVVEPVIRYFNLPDTNVAGVLLQNAQFTYNKLEDDVWIEANRISQIDMLLKNMAKYAGPTDTLITYISSEFSMIIEGITMAEFGLTE